MELNLIIALALAFNIGLSLGLLGSGGSIITLPVLVYVGRVPVTSAVVCGWQLSLERTICRSSVSVLPTTR
jgi:uncharacterized membrane protein YfcA